MKFCGLCNNMFFASMVDDNRLEFRCNYCGNKEVKDDDATEVILDQRKIDDDERYEMFANKNIKYDPTIPRVSGMKCGNAAYLKYDFKDMKFIYYCCVCETFFKNRRAEAPAVPT
jgi:DNA-directed RNA polymerase subunit M/transcription elongation factor TFIIS